MAKTPARRRSGAWSFDPSDVDVSGDLTLVVARRSGKNLKGNKVDLHQDVAAALKGAVDTTLTRFASLESRAFEPDLRIDKDHEFLLVPDALVDTDAAIRAVLDTATGLDRISARDLPRQGFLFYAVVFGATPATRRAFVRKWNPRRTAQPGRITTFFSDRLRRVRDPVLVFDSQFDLVVVPGGIAVLNQDVFDSLFRDITVMEGRIPEYVKGITAVLPLHGDGAGRLAERCLSDSRLAKRLRAINERGHLASVKIADLREEAKRQGLDESKLFKANKLVFDDASPAMLLKLLNEDLFVGGLSGQAFEAGSKSTRQ